jgi:hypothetical protein
LDDSFAKISRPIILNMKAKLTISIDEKILKQAKAYARRHKISLSKLIEDILRELIEKD